MLIFNAVWLLEGSKNYGFLNNFIYVIMALLDKE